MSEPRDYEERRAPQPVDPWVRWLLGLLVVAFSAWAGLVWQGVQTVKEVAVEVRFIRQAHEELKVESRMADVDIRREVKTHDALEWHDGAGYRLKALEKDHERIIPSGER